MNRISLAIYLISASFLIGACVQKTQEEKEISELIGKKINLDMFEEISYKNSTITLDRIRSKYKFLSLVYLQDDCLSCFPLYFDWHHKLDSIKTMDHYSILFIIEGSSIGSIHNISDDVRKNKRFEEKYYTVIDSGYYFLKGNPNIPDFILKRSVTVDKKGKIRFVGTPFASQEMFNLFLKITKQD